MIDENGRMYVWPTTAEECIEASRTGHPVQCNRCERQGVCQAIAQMTAGKETKPQ